MSKKTIEQTKTCKKCLIEKTVNLFYSGRTCKECAKHQMRERYKNKKDEVKAYRKRNAQKLAKTAFRLKLKNNYNMTIELYEQIFNAQDGKCAICKTSDFKGLYSRPHVDHCHVTGQVRGILCHHCNTGLGLFRDDKSLLQAAAEYLQQPSKRTCL